MMNTTHLKVLLLEDLESDAYLTVRQLKKDDPQVITQRVDTKQEFIEALHQFVPDVILSDHSLPQFNSLAALEIARHEQPNIPFILVTGTVSEEFAVACIKAGADDYILKDNLVRLTTAIKTAMVKRGLQYENEVIKELNEEIKEKNKNITDSICYALNIQNALMQEKNDLKEYFPESFIFLQARNIVSGDFYWFKEVNGKYLLAAGDCTGHGVPGALLTIMGMNILHSGVGVHGISDPAELLGFVDQDLHRKLAHEKGGRAVNDGMDMAFCSIDPKTMTLTVTGANSHVYLVRDNEIEQISTEKYSLGTGDIFKQFEAKKIQLKKGDKLYFSTDGFRDQFGGEQGKKLGSVRFKEILLSISKEEFDKQEAMLSNIFTQWQGDTEQTDDVMVMGIKI